KLDVPADHLLLREEPRRLAVVDVHDGRTDLVCGPQRPPELGQGRLPDAAKGGADGDEPGRVRHYAQAVTVHGRSNGLRVDLAGIGGRRLQREVHEVEAVPPEPVDLLQRVAGRVVHRTDLHGSLPVNSIPSGYSTGAAGTMGAGRSAMRPAVLTIGHSNHPLERFLALLARH